MAPPACPDWTRRSQASTDLAKVPRLFGISRVALLPSWWQPVHPSVLTMLRIHSPWLLMPAVCTKGVGVSGVSGVAQDPPLGSVRPRDTAPDVIVVDGLLSTGALAGRGARQSCDDEREDGDRREREVEESSRHLAPP